jgi:hypothetical protein
MIVFLVLRLQNGLDSKNCEGNTNLWICSRAIKIFLPHGQGQKQCFGAPKIVLLINSQLIVGFCLETGTGASFQALFPLMEEWQSHKT